MSSLVVIRSVDTAPEAVGEVPKGKGVACVKLYLETGLPAICSERTFGHHKPHNVADIELAHGPKVSAMFR